MNLDNRRRLRTPQGTEGVYLEEAYRHRKLLRMTEDYFSSWGYHPVLTPVFDYYETYRHLLDHDQVERSYRFPGRDGELLMLRSDITLFLAKQMGLALKNNTVPRRVYYADSILRHQEEEDITNDEFFQSGGELIGVPGREGDLEVLMLLYDLLAAMELPKWRVHIGSRNVINAVLAQRGNVMQVEELLAIRDVDSLIRVLTNAGLPEAEFRAQLLLFLGTPDEFASLSEQLILGCGRYGENAIKESIRELVSLTSNLNQITFLDNIRIDLSEHGGQPYYTGFTVKVYIEGASSAVAAGGRYDGLLGTFGSDIPAAGFSLLARKIEPLSGFAAAVPEEMMASRARGMNFTQRYNDAVSRRKSGEQVALS